jgi:probable phosphomutase (TIGR03848 family)
MLLIRHGRTTANAAGTLAGWTPGVHLDDTGRDQVTRLAARLSDIPIAQIVTSPLERCQETAGLLVQGGDPARRPSIDPDERIGECRYGTWEGQPLASLSKEDLWPVVQAHPSAVRFPGGESLLEMQLRAVTALREHNDDVAQRYGQGAVWAAVSHADVIKAVVADALGLHLDQFQRIAADPASVTVIRYTRLRPFVVRLNDTGPDLGPLVTALATLDTSDAPVGGGAGVPAQQSNPTAGPA